MARTLLWDKVMKRFALVSLLLVPMSACLFHDDDDDCKYYAGDTAIVAYELRDPMTGLCQPVGGGGGCDDPCSPCAEGDRAAPASVPDWGECYSHCEGLGEDTCKTTSGCRAAYEGSAFHQCWATAQSGPIQGGTCAGLDAQECSRHDDCVAVHGEVSGTGIGSFMSCAAEGTVQDPGSCVGDVICATLPPACPDGTIAGRTNGCWTGYCIPHAQCDELPSCGDLDENDCIGRTDCSPIYEGQGCTCTANGCTCQSWTFDSCKTM